MTPASSPRSGAVVMTAGAWADHLAVVARLAALSTPDRYVDAGRVDDVTYEMCSDDSTPATVTVGFWAENTWRCMQLCPGCAVWHIEHCDGRYVDVEVRVSGFALERRAA